MRGLMASQAYQASAKHRNVREQEADVFRRVNIMLRGAHQDDTLARAKAVADNRRLWIATIDLMRDSANGLPLPLRASVVSVGLAVQREMEQPDPDLAFLIGINEQIAAGLSGN